MIIRDSIQTNLLTEKNIHYSLIMPEDCQKTLFWLHGYRERSEQLLQYEVFDQSAQKHHMAIIFPDVPDTYYLNQSWNHCYTEDFLVEEFIPTVIKKYHLPDESGVTFLAGISMGGFGSLLIGSHYPERFGKIACVSGAFIVDDLLIGNPEITGAVSNIQHFRNLFGDIPSLAEDSARNPWLAVKTALDTGCMPPVYLACGTEDLLYSRNQKMYRQLKMAGTDVTWAEEKGNHDKQFFSHAIPEVLDWLVGGGFQTV